MHASHLTSQPAPAPYPTQTRGDYRVMAVLQKVKALQLECRRAGIAVPLDSVLRRDRALSLPGGGLGGAQAPAAEKKGKDKSKSKGKGKEAAHEAPAATPISAAARSEAVPAATAPAAAAAASVASAVTGQQRYGRRPPQTLFEWLHLLSPLLTLIFGILYALARAMGTGAGAAS